MGENNSKCINPTETLQRKEVDLGEMAKLWALDEIQRHPIEKNGWNLFQKFYKHCELCMECNFDEVRILQGQTEYEDFDDAETSSTQVLMKSHFTNNSHVEQTQSFSGTNSIESSLKVILQNTICVGNDTKLKLLLPEEIVQETTHFGKQVQITKKYGYEDKKEIDWKVDHLVRIPAYSYITAEHVLLERDITAWFSVPVTLLGNINVIITEAKTNTVLKVLEGNIASIVNFNMEPELEIQDNDAYTYIQIPSHNVSHRRQALDWDVAEGQISYVVRGHCRFRYGVEQLVKLGGASQL